MAVSLDLRLYGLLDPSRSRGRALARLAEGAVAGGVTLLQYRDKLATTRVMVETVAAIRSAVAGSGVPLLVNDRVDVALAGEADGVHLGRDDLDPRQARRFLGENAIIGLTVKTASDLAEPLLAVADYICIGGVFETGSKDNPGGAIGLPGLHRLVGEARRAAPGLPVAAIAGIDATNAASVIAAGADGVAVISALFMADDVAAEARRLRTIVEEALAGQAVVVAR